MNWLSFIVDNVVDRIPLEKILVRHPDRHQELMELRDIMKGSQQVKEKVAAPAVDTPPKHIAFTKEDASEPASPRVHLTPNANVTSQVTTKETVDYQNREIGKALLMMQRHCAQRFRINGKPCDCGQSRHLLEMEALVDEVIPMVENPEIYYRIRDWIKRLGPKSTIKALNDHKYDDEYPVFSNEARDLRKELLGTLDVDALFPDEKPEITAAPEEVPAEV